jgi:5-methyltetrahydrofolate--homocysteine methyltransferase
VVSTCTGATCGGRGHHTNTFTATSIGQSDYLLQPLVPGDLRGAELARQAADEAGGRFVVARSGR